MNKLIALLGATAAMGLAAPANAVLNVPIPVGAYITVAGLDWAWAIPLPGAGYPNALDYQATQGWRLPTADELAVAPLATAFMFDGANVPFGGTDAVSGAYFAASNSDLTGAAACATPYFGSGYSHCDWQDGLGQPDGPWAGMPNAADFAEQLFVRGAMSAAVPEPASWAMMVAGLGVLGYAMRRRRVAVRFA